MAISILPLQKLSISLGSHSMWPWQSLSCERSSLLRGVYPERSRRARNDKEHNTLQKEAYVAPEQLATHNLLPIMFRSGPAGI